MVGEALRRIARLDVADPEIEPSDQRLGLPEQGDPCRAGGRAAHRLPSAGPARRSLRPRALPDRGSGADGPLDAWFARTGRCCPPMPSSSCSGSTVKAGVHLTVRVRGQTAWGQAAALHRELAARGVPAVLWWEPEGGAPRAVAGAPEPWPAAGVRAGQSGHGGSGPPMGAVPASGRSRGSGPGISTPGSGRPRAAPRPAGATVRERRAGSPGGRAGGTAWAGGGRRRHAGRAEDVAPRLPAPAW